MENDPDPEMDELEARQRSLGRAFDSLNVQASSVLLFTAQWKELEDHFESSRKELRTRLAELEERVKLVAEVEARAVRLKTEMEAKAKDLGEMEEVVEQKRREVEEGNRQLCCINLLIEENREELRVCESQCSHFDRLVKERSRKLNWVEKRVEEKLNRVEVEERKLDEIRGLIEEKRRELEECKGELELKEERLRLVEKSIVNCDKILDLKEKLVSVVDLKVKDFCLLEKSMEEWSCKLEMKERELEGCVTKIEAKEGQVDRKIEELNLVHSKFLDEVQLKEKHLGSLEESVLEREKDLLFSVQKLVQECCQGSEFTRDGRGIEQFMDEHLMRIDSMCIELSAILKESSDPAKLVLDAMQGFYPDNRELHFDLMVRRRGCCLLLKELKTISPQISPQVREEATKLAANWKAKMTVASDNDLEVLGFLRLVAAYDLASIYDAKELKGLLSSVSNGQQAAHIGQALGFAAPASLQSSLEPAKLVLDWMQTDLSQYWTKGDVWLEATSIKTCIFVLQQLMRVVPHVGQHVKEDAMKLAVQWKAKLRANAENAWEILGFLHFIAAYGLIFTLNVDDIVTLLGMIAQHKQALEFCWKLPSEDKIPGEFIHCLVERKQLMEAIGLICTFKLINSIPPVPLLKEYVKEKMKCCRDGNTKEKLHDEKVKVVDQHITDLRAVINLIKDYNLESEYPSSNVEMEITQLEKVKEKWRIVQSGNVDKEQKRGTKRRSSTPPTKLEPQQQPNKSHRTAVISPRPHPLQLYTPVYLQPNASPLLLHSRQFGTIQNAGILPSPSYAGILHPSPSYRPNLPPWNHLPNFGSAFFPF
ncbi:hypothetical protein RchiOBHm_Chr3g0452981 [Rosa chinensis]|uniref:FRIGIDA-like protein n=1 Tax=Rosa chinensis TaxID=74649 RepID=A0A2P6R6H5_ROSCH|nr:FRIGIDA-like protein 5 [Rosa chinensis]PRQ42009.1 hypothetical protein RchiOBHm_Chr3g0452981 [Rosa chinensis]